MAARKSCRPTATNSGRWRGGATSPHGLAIYRSCILESPERTISREAVRVSNRLYGVLDLLQSESGVRFARAEGLYLHDVNTDWALIHATIGIVVLVLVLGLVCATLIVRRLTRGVQNVVDTAHAVSNGRARSASRRRRTRRDLAGGAGIQSHDRHALEPQTDQR